MSVVVLPELPQDEWDLSQWLELLAAEKPGGAGAHSLTSSEESVVINIPDNQRRSAIRQLLGWAWADDEEPYLLHREAVAVQHPQTPWLWVDAVAPTPRNPFGTLQPDLTRKAKRPGVGFDGYAPEFTTNYGRSDITVRFKNVWWRQYADWDPVWQRNYIGKEWMRSFGTVSKGVQLDLLTAEGAGEEADLYYADANAAIGLTSGPGGTAFRGTQYVRQQRTTFKLIWRCVPINYTCGEVRFNEDDISSFLMPYPERLYAALGCVNSTPFPGANSPYRPGTLMLTGVEETPYQLPVRTDSEFGLLAADYTLIFEHFDPPRDPDATPNPSGSQIVYGHNLMPFRPSARYWYYVTSGTGTTRGTYNGNPILRSVDFHNMFRHRNNPLYPIP